VGKNTRFLERKDRKKKPSEKRRHFGTKTARGGTRRGKRAGDFWGSGALGKKEMHGKKMTRVERGTTVWDRARDEAGKGIGQIAL